MATLDKFAPYATGMTAKEAVQSLWNAKDLTSYSKVIRSTTPPSYADITNDCSFWYNASTNKLYRVSRNTTDQIVVYFEV